jgi:putative heme-binding domain-containing protein
LIHASRSSLVRQHIARRTAALSDSPRPLELLSQFLPKLRDEAMRADVLHGMRLALEGRQQMPMPAEWPAAYRELSRSASESVREQATALALVFGDREAYQSLRTRLADTSEAHAKRQAALVALAEQRDPQIVPLLHKLIAEEGLSGHALRALAAYDDPQTPAVILDRYAAFSEADKRDAVLTLSARPAYALAMLAAMEQGKLPRADLSAFVVRQLASIKDRQLQRKVAEVWGSVRTTPQEKREQIAAYKTKLDASQLQKADRSHGRALFQRDCANCHKLFDAGGQIGPDLTGSQRANLDYVLENLVDPSALVGRDYQMSVFQTADGRVINGIVLREDEGAVVVQTQNDRVALAKSEIEAREQSRVSLMPEGQLSRLSDQELRDLVAYLGSPEQVPLPAGASPPRSN